MTAPPVAKAVSGKVGKPVSGKAEPLPLTGLPAHSPTFPP